MKTYEIIWFSKKKPNQTRDSNRKTRKTQKKIMLKNYQTNKIQSKHKNTQKTNKQQHKLHKIGWLNYEVFTVDSTNMK